MVYTKTGDNGTTSLVGGSRVKKCCHRVEAYGTADELNSHIGLLAEMLLSENNNCQEEFDKLYGQLKRVQNNLFVMQTLLATEDEATYQKLPQLPASSIQEMESWIDAMEQRLPRLKSFVIAGGSVASAQAHVARTVCRRAERTMVALNEEEKIEENLLKFINRTSDYLFVVSRYILLLENKKENFWSVE